MFVNRIINDYFNKKNKFIANIEDITENERNDIKFLKFEFIPGLSNKIEHIFKRFLNTTKFVYYNNKNVYRLFSKVKDKDDISQQSNIVYKINCNNCNTCYIGQTKQYFKDRLRQHKNDCNITNINKVNKTALATHHFKEENHNFDFDNARIVDRENNWLKRNISEMIQIELNTNNINFKTDTQNLNPHYKNLLLKYTANQRN